jgi:hypothetical protein
VATLVFVPAVFAMLHGVRKGESGERLPKHEEQPLHA